MADLRIADAPVVLQESITDDVKMPTGGLGNFSIRLGDIVWYVVTKEQLANKDYVDLSSQGVKDSLDAHIADTNNPHQVTKEQVGLGNVDNTADIDKPVSNATKAYIITNVYSKDETNSKINTVSGGYYGAFDTFANLQASTGAKTGQVAKVMNDTLANNGDYRYTGSAWVKGYDALTDAKNYTNDIFINRTVQSAKINSKELAVFTDKNGRRTWLEVAADGGLTEHTKQIIKKAIVPNELNIATINTSYVYAITDKNGRILSGIDKNGGLYPKQAVSGDKRFKILGIGNSFTQDAFMYVPFLLKEMGVTKFEIAVLIYGGCTLEQHWNFASNDSKVYNLEVFKSENDTWQSLGARTLKEALNYTDFDTITLQQQSARSYDYNTYQPFLNNLVNYIYTNINYPTRLGWHGIPAQPDYAWVSTMTSAEFYAAQVQAYKNVLRDTPFEYVIPNNTAVQNARGTVLGTLGDAGNMTQDNLHLQDGIPALVAAYAVTLKCLEVFNLRKSIFGSRIAPTDAWLSTKGIQGQNGNSVGVTTDNILIAQKCAIAAIKNPFETSTIN